MAGKWKETTLSEVSHDVSYGYTESATPEQVGPKFLRITDIQGGVVNWESVPFCQISKVNYTKYKLEDGDIVVARTGNSTGENYLFRGNADAVFASYLIRFRLDPTEAEPCFVWYNLRTATWWDFINSSKTGSAQAGANAKVLGRFPLRLPPLREQQAIACILGALDDKIELNRRMNRTLEEMARAIFKSWFVDFDPVHAKAAVRREHPNWTNEQVSRAACPKLKTEIAELFPDAFEDSELGEIPKGWEVKPLPELIEVNPTRTLRKGEFAPYLDMANMPTRGHSPDTVTERPFGSGMRFVNGDTLVARITPCLENGKTAFVDFLTDGQVGWGSTEYIVLRPKPPLPVEFAYCLARSDGFRDFAIQRMTGSSGRQRVPAELLAHFRLVDADRSVTELFGRLVQPLFARAGAATRESRILAALRDALLPKLISGELRVKDAEKFVERMAI